MQDAFGLIVAEQFSFVKALSKGSSKAVTVLRHRGNGTMLVKITGVGSCDVYRLLEKINHPNLPVVYGVIEDGERFTVYEEYIDSVSVAQVLSTGLYTESGVRTVAKGVCNALAVLHSQNIIHRDIKPENVLVDKNANVKLIDFDAARIFKTYKSQDTAFVGTAGFAAPEQFGINQTDCRADIFALGIMMNVMLTGEHPSKKLYSGKLGKVIEKCINIDPNRRYANAKELFDEL